MPRALLVGSNYPDTDYSLHGCVNDTRLLQILLSSTYGYKDEVLVLSDKTSFKPTRGNILAGIAWLYSDAKVEDFRGEEGLRNSISSSSRAIPISGVPLVHPMKLLGKLGEAGSRFVLPSFIPSLPLDTSILPVASPSDLLPISSLPPPVDTIAEKLVKKIFALIEELRNLLRGNQNPAALEVLSAFESLPLEHLASINDIAQAIDPLAIVDGQLPNLDLFDAAPSLSSLPLSSLPVASTLPLSSLSLEDITSVTDVVSSLPVASTLPLETATDAVSSLPLENITSVTDVVSSLPLSSLPVESVVSMISGDDNKGADSSLPGVDVVDKLNDTDILGTLPLPSLPIVSSLPLALPAVQDAVSAVQDVLPLSSLPLENITSVTDVSALQDTLASVLPLPIGDNDQKTLDSDPLLQTLPLSSLPLETVTDVVSSLPVASALPIENITSVTDVVSSLPVASTLPLQSLPLETITNVVPVQNLPLEVLPLDSLPVVSSLPLQSLPVASTIPVVSSLSQKPQNPLGGLIGKLNALGSLTQVVNKVSNVTGPLASLIAITESLANTQSVLLANLPALMELESLAASPLSSLPVEDLPVLSSVADVASTRSVDTVDIHLAPREGEKYFFSFSGHGTQITDDNGDEKDGFDEVICPLDFEEKGPITDDLLRRLLVDNLPASSKLTVVLDCCNSGTGLDLPLEIKKSFFGNVSLKGDEDLKTGSVCLISGCRDNQVSADVSRGGQDFGACTYSLTQLLRTKKPETYKTLQDSLRKYIKNQRFSGQEPCLTFARHEDLNAAVEF